MYYGELEGGIDGDGSVELILSPFFKINGRFLFVFLHINGINGDDSKLKGS